MQASSFMYLLGWKTVVCFRSFIRIHVFLLQ